MPVVPFSKAAPLAPGDAASNLPPFDFALMAAAQMHGEGRLVEPKPEKPSHARSVKR